MTKTQSNGTDWYGVIRGAVSGAASQGQAKNGPVRYDYIVEHGFHDNPKECLFLSKQENLKAIAEAKAAAIAEYFGIGNQKQSANQSGHSSQNNRNNNSHQTDQNTSTDSTTLNKKTAYLVRVSIGNLNIRQAPTIYSKAVGFTGKGVFPCSHAMSIQYFLIFSYLNPPSKASGIAVALFQTFQATFSA